MFLFDPTEPFALLDTVSASFVSMILGKNPATSDRFAGYFRDDREKPKPFLVDESGKILSAENTAEGTSPGRKLIAVVPLTGTLSPDGRYWGTSTKQFVKQVTGFANDSQIGAIVLRVDSPGGTAVGNMEAGEAIRALRGTKPIVTSVDSLMASAATWIGTAASEVSVTPSGEAGSIGVISMYADFSKAYEEYGIKIDVMRIPALKARFSGVEPLTEEMRATLKSRLDECYSQFKRAMADNRNVRVDTIESKFGGGEMLLAKEALEAGLVDRIESYDQLLNRLFLKMERKSNSSSHRAAAIELQKI